MYISNLENNKDAFEEQMVYLQNQPAEVNNNHAVKPWTLDKSIL